MNAFLAGGAWLEEVGHWGCPALEGYVLCHYVVCMRVYA